MVTDAKTRPAVVAGWIAAALAGALVLGGCRTVPLQAGSAQPVAVSARRETSLAIVEHGKRYRIRSTGTWKDASTDTGPLGYDSRRWLFRKTEALRFDPDANWFALVGRIASTAGGKTAYFDLSPYVDSARDWEAPASGTLLVRANDLWFMAFNNSGALSVTVEPVP